MKTMETITIITTPAVGGYHYTGYRGGTFSLPSKELPPFITSGEHLWGGRIWCTIPEDDRQLRTLCRALVDALVSSAGESSSAVQVYMAVAGAWSIVRSDWSDWTRWTVETLGKRTVPGCFRRFEPRTPRVLTREDSDPGGEWPQIVRDERVALAGVARHMSRVEAAEYALARAYATDLRHVDESTIDTLRVVAMLEHRGIGGRRGYGGGATRRMPWSQSLGKGRHHATDGAAWDAAILEVFGGALEPTPEKLLDALELGVEPAWPLAEALRKAVAAESPAQALRWVSAARAADVDSRYVGHTGIDAEREYLLSHPAIVPASTPKIEIVSRRALPG